MSTAHAHTRAAEAEDLEDARILAEMDAGRFISNEAIMRWVSSWADETPLPPPSVGD